MSNGNSVVGAPYTANARCARLLRNADLWEYVRTAPVPIVYYAPHGHRDRAPPYVRVVTDPELMSSLSGPALKYGKRIVVCTHAYSDVPYGDFLHIVRL